MFERIYGPAIGTKNVSYTIGNERYEKTVNIYNFHKTSLPLLVYNDELYNQERRMKMISCIICLEKYDIFNKFSLEKRQEYILKFENIWYNTARDKAKKNNYRLSWNDPMFVNIYHEICFKTLSNIEKDGMVKNDHFVFELFTNDIKIEEIGSISSQQMFPALYTEINDKIEKQKNAKFAEKPSHIHTCPKCGKNECSERKSYTRSMDEEIGIIVTCISCGAMFKGH